jgi:hypothetical protein
MSDSLILPPNQISMTIEEFKEFILKCGKNINTDFYLEDNRVTFIDPAHIYMAWKDFPELDNEYMKTELINRGFTDAERPFKQPPKLNRGTEFTMSNEFEWLKKSIMEYRKDYSNNHISEKFSEDSMYVFFQPSKGRMFIGRIYDFSSYHDKFSGDAISVPIKFDEVPQVDALFFQWSYVKPILATLPDKPITCHLYPVLWMESGTYRSAVAPYGWDDSTTREMQKFARNLVGIIEESGISASVDEYEVDE